MKSNIIFQYPFIEPYLVSIYKMANSPIKTEEIQETGKTTIKHELSNEKYLNLLTLKLDSLVHKKLNSTSILPTKKQVNKQKYISDKLNKYFGAISDFPYVTKGRRSREKQIDL